MSNVFEVENGACSLLVMPRLASRLTTFCCRLRMETGRGTTCGGTSSVQSPLVVVCAKCGCYAQSRMELVCTCANPSARQVFARLVARVPRRPSPKRGNARMMQPWRLLPDAEVVKA